MPAILTELLRLHQELSRFQRPDDFVFCREDGPPLDPDHLRNQVLYPAMDRAGIKRIPRAHGYHPQGHGPQPLP